MADTNCCYISHFWTNLSAYLPNTIHGRFCSARDVIIFEVQEQLKRVDRTSDESF